MLYFNLTLTIISCVFVWFREKSILELDKMYGVVDKRDSLVTSGYYKKVICEFIILFIHPYPFFLGMKISFFNRKIEDTIYYHFNDLFSLLSIIKSLYVFKTGLQFTIWRTSRAERIW